MLPLYMNIDLLREALAGRVFDAREASVVLGVGLDTARHLLRDLRVSGHVVRVERGRYRVLSTPDRLRIERARVTLRLQAALDTDLRIALDGPDAVHAWTEGRYTANLRHDVIHIAVHDDDHDAYTQHLDTLGIPHGPNPEPPPGRRPYVALRRTPVFETVQLDGVTVVDRQTTLAYIRANPVTFDGADEWFR